MRELHNVVRHQAHENRTKTDRVSATVTRKIANYLAYGRGRPAQQQQREPRGAWLDQTSQTRTHDEVSAWVAQEGKTQRYTHQLILSMKDEWLTHEAYNRALAVGGPFFTEWRSWPIPIPATRTPTSSPLVTSRFALNPNRFATGG